MRPLLIPILAVSALLPAVATATAQKGYALGIAGGAAIPVGKLGDVQKTGYSALLTLALGSPDLPIGMRFDGIYNNLTQTQTTPATANATGDLPVGGAPLDLVYAFP